MNTCVSEAYKRKKEKEKRTRQLIDPETNDKQSGKGLKRMNTYTWSRLQSHKVARPDELTRMSALNCILLNSLVAIKLASSLTVFSLRVLIVHKAQHYGRCKEEIGQYKKKGREQKKKRRGRKKKIQEGRTCKKKII